MSGKSIVGVVLAFVLSGSPAIAAGPELVAPVTVVDFGEVLQGAKVEHSFTFRNGGDAELVIGEVRSSCGCTAALVSAERLPPGGKGELRAVFDSGRFRGPVSKTISLHSNDPRRPVVDFQLRGTVRPEIELSPEQVDLGIVPPGGRREIKVTVTNRGKREIDFFARSTTPDIQVNFPHGKLAPGKSRTFPVKVTPGKESRGVSGYVLLTPRGGGVPELRLPVHGVVGDVR